MQEKQGTQVRSLGRKDPLEEKIGSHSSVLSWRIPWTEEPGGLQSTGSQRVGHQWASKQWRWRGTSCYVFSSHFYLLFGERLFSSQFLKLGYLSFSLFCLPHSMPDLRIPHQGSNPLHLQWKHVVLTTGLPGDSWAVGILPAERTYLQSFFWWDNRPIWVERIKRALWA